MDHRDLLRGASAEQRVLAAVHRHFRRLGGSPSYRELSLETAVPVPHIGELLLRLELAGYLRLTRGRARSIELARRGAGLSDVELELEAIARGATVHWPAQLVAEQLHEAFPTPEPGTDLELGLEELLGQIDAAEEKRHGAGEAAPGEGGEPGTD